MGQTDSLVSAKLCHMPKRVVVICLLLCLGGFFSGWQLSGLLLSAREQAWAWWPVIVVTGGFLCLPAGVGMLMGYRWGRALAVVAFSVGYLVCAAMLATPLLDMDLVRIDLNGNRPDFGVFATASLLLLGVLLLLHWTLFSPPFEDHLS